MQNNKDDLECLIDIGLAIQKSLLHVITPELRAITFDLDDKKRLFYIDFYYEGNVSENIIELWKSASTEASAHLGPDYHTIELIQRLDYPGNILNDKILIYYKKEPKVLANFTKTKDLLKCNYIEKFFSSKIRCEMQKAILGNITPNIRQINIEWKDQFIYIHFYYHGKVSDSDIQNMNLICKIFSLSFNNCYVYLRYFSINEPILLPIQTEVIYARYEKDYGQEALFKPLF